MDVGGLSAKRLEILVEAGLVQTPADLFRIVNENCDGESMVQSIATLDGWGTKSAQNLRSAVQTAVSGGEGKGVDLSRFIYSLGIRHIGVHSSKLVAGRYGTVERFLEAVEEAGRSEEDRDEGNREVESLFADLHRSRDNNNNDRKNKTDNNDDEGVAGIGPVMIRSLLAFARDNDLVAAAKDLASVLTITPESRRSERSKPSSSSTDDNERQSSSSPHPSPLEGKVVVFIGKVSDDLTRSAAQKAAKKVLGAKSTPGSVSRSTDVVVEGGGGHGGTRTKKIEEALRLGVRLMSAEEFLRLVEQYGG